MSRLRAAMILDYYGISKIAIQFDTLFAFGSSTDGDYSNSMVCLQETKKLC